MMRPPRRRLVLHDAEGVLGAQERAGEVGIHHRLPLLEGEILKIDRRGAHAGIVEEHVEPAVSAPSPWRTVRRSSRDRSCRMRRTGSCRCCRRVSWSPPASPCGGRRAPRCKPAFISASDAARPTPVPAPVTTAIFSFVSAISFIPFTFLLLFRSCTVVSEYSGAPGAAPPTSASEGRGNRARPPRCGD